MPALSCIVPHMTHTEWMQKHERLAAELVAVHTRRDELQKYCEYIPGPVLQKRDRVLELREQVLVKELDELLRLDKAGAVS